MSGAISKVRSESRNVWAITIYRWLIGTLFLLVAFSEFKEHWLPIALGSLVIGQGFAAVSSFHSMMSASENALLDLAERKTRHTIVVAQHWAINGKSARGFEGYEFWREVNDAVEEEAGAADQPRWWVGLSLTVVNLLYRIVADVIGIGIAFSLAGVGNS